jgi:hypothetical protein|tara:strand:+ start:31 stop:1056 length:1026 start_codon:yes stop_codon:yes gene_type:complete
MKFLNDVEITGSGADLSCAASVTFSGLSSSSQTTAVVINSSGVLSKRALGSNAFNSTSFLTAHPAVEGTAIEAGGSNNSGRTYIQDITLDDFGHVTAIGTATETVTNTNTQNVHTLSFVDSGSNCILRNTKSGASEGTADLTFVAGDGISLTPSGSNLTITASGGGGDSNAGTYRGSFRPANTDIISSGGNTGVKNTVSFDTAVFTASGISVSSDEETIGQITVANAGIYQVAFNFASENHNTLNRLLVGAELQVKGSGDGAAFEAIPGTRVFNYNRGIQTSSGAAAWGTIFEGSANSTILHSFSANDVIRAQFWIDGRSTSASGAKTLIAGCRLSLHNIS